MATHTAPGPDLRYPVGNFQPPAMMTDALRREYIETIAAMPAKLRAAVAGLNPQQLETPYRPGGWTVRQVVHHLADSHMNAFCRVKLALTEEQPTIKPYNEARWAELADTTAVAHEVSLQLLDALHQRWTTLLRALKPADFGRTLSHPERGLMTLDDVVALYAWHSRHHVGHITALRARSGWK